MKYKVENISYDLKGVFETEKKRRFYISGLLKNEEIEVEKNGKIHTLTKIITSSPERIKVKCPQFYQCGGCQYQHVTYEKEIELKKAYLNNLFKGIYKKPIELYKMTDYQNYRTKVTFTFTTSKRHQLSLAMFKENSRELITIENCNLNNDSINKLAKEILKILAKYKLRAYDEYENKGLLKHLLIKYSEVTKEFLVCLVLNDKSLPKRKEIVKDIIALNMNVKTIVENYNMRRTPIVLGEAEKVIYGEGYINDVINDKKFRIYAKTFYQINHEGVEVLYSKCIDSLKLTNKETLLDAYCGVGTMGIIASNKVKRVIGIELNKESVKSAMVNAKINNVKNITFIAADATQKINELSMSRENKIDSLIMDPPREGSTTQFIDAVAKLRIPKIAYVSCDPQTLKRDLDYFKIKGYEIKHIEAVDMFPRTFNVECIALIGLKGAK